MGIVSVSLSHVDLLHRKYRLVSCFSGICYIVSFVFLCLDALRKLLAVEVILQILHSHSHIYTQQRLKRSLEKGLWPHRYGSRSQEFSPLCLIFFSFACLSADLLAVGEICGSGYPKSCEVCLGVSLRPFHMPPAGTLSDLLRFGPVSLVLALLWSAVSQCCPEAAVKAAEPMQEPPAQTKMFSTLPISSVY